VYEATMDRDAVRARMEETLRDPPSPQMAEQAEQMLAEGGPHLGVASDRITTRVDVSSFTDQKRAALAAHRSQVPADSWWMTVPPAEFAGMFGTEYFIHRGAPAGTVETDLGLG